MAPLSAPHHPQSTSHYWPNLFWPLLADQPSLLVPARTDDSTLDSPQRLNPQQPLSTSPANQSLPASHRRHMSCPSVSRHALPGRLPRTPQVYPRPGSPTCQYAPRQANPAPYRPTTPTLSFQASSVQADYPDHISTNRHILTNHCAAACATPHPTDDPNLSQSTTSQSRAHGPVGRRARRHPRHPLLCDEPRQAAPD